MQVNRFAHHSTEVSGYRQVAAFVELGLIEARPASVNLAAFHRTAHHKHYIRVAVVGAAVAVLASGAAELRHGDDHGIFGEVAEIDPEGTQRLREFAQHIGDLPLRAAFVDVMIPAADVGKGYVYAQVRFNKLGKLFE